MDPSDLPPSAMLPHAAKRQAETARDLLQPAPPASPEDNNHHIRDLFTSNPTLISVPVVEGRQPIGLITRDIFLSQMARQFAHEVYGKKSCIAFMDKSPLIVDVELDITSLSAKAIETGEKALKDGFIITQGGNYAGIGAGFELVKALSDLQIEKNRMLTDSINYASVIQRSFLSSSSEQLRSTLDDHFLIWEPRDVVGGDCYFFQRRPHGFFAAVIDCTGHGVPGAFMTLIASSSLAQVLRTVDPSNPAAVMNELNRVIKVSLRQEAEHADAHTNSDDGFDAAFLWFDAGDRTITFAGAKTPLFHTSPAQPAITLVESDRRGVGYVETAMNYAWNNHLLPAPEGAAFYVTTDGIIDQIGSARRIALGKRRFVEGLERQKLLAMASQGDALRNHYRTYQGAEERRDDVTALGFRVTPALLASFGGAK